MISRIRLLVLAILLFVAGSALAIRTLVSQGFFTPVPANTAIACRIIPTAEGPEELAFDPASRQVFISARDRRKPRSDPGPNDGLYIFSIDRPGSMPVKLTGVPKNFHPHGMSLYRDADGRLTVMVVNHRANKSSVVEIFSAVANRDGVNLLHRATIEGGLLLSPNDLVAVGHDRFYVTNDRGSTSDFGIWLERNLLLARSTLVYFDGEKLSLAVEGLRSANGVARSADGKKIYVAELSARRIRTYLRDPYFGTLTVPDDETKAIWPLPFGIDNIDVAPDGRIAAAGHVKIPQSRAFLTNPGEPSPSMVHLVATTDGFPSASRLIFADDGKRLGASSIGLLIGNRLIIGSPFEKKILDCVL